MQVGDIVYLTHLPGNPAAKVIDPTRKRRDPSIGDEAEPYYTIMVELDGFPMPVAEDAISTTKED